jgi:hypothetical protein
MTTRRRRLTALFPILLTLAACGPATSGGVSATDGGGAATAAPGAAADASRSLSTEPSSGTPSGSEAVTQTDTPWGRIWDQVPAGFPRFPASTPAADASAAPSSARFAVQGGDPEEIAAWLQSALKTARFSTDVYGPLEDGSVTIDAVGDGQCRAQTTINPLGDMTFITVLYGASCPMA